MHCLYFICERKFYARTHVKITRYWKSIHRAEALLSGDPGDAKKVSITGAGRLRECENTEDLV